MSILSIKNQRFESPSKCMKRKDEIYLDFYKMSGTRVFIKKNLRPTYCVHMTKYWNSCWLEGKQMSNYLTKYLNKENSVNMALFLMCVILNTPAMIRITVRYQSKELLQIVGKIPSHSLKDSSTLLFSHFSFARPFAKNPKLSPL